MQTKKLFNWRYDVYSTLNQCFIDAALTGISFWLAYQLRFDWALPPYHVFQMWLLLPFVMFGRISVSAAAGTYRLIWRYVGLSDLFILSRNYVLFSVFLLALRFALPDKLGILHVPLSIIIIEFVLSLQGALAARVFRRVLHEGWALRPKQEQSTRVLLIGAGQAGAMVAKEIAANQGIKAIGFLDDDSRKKGTLVNGLRVLGNLDLLPIIVREQEVQEVIVCIPRPSRKTLKRVWALCEELAVPVKVMPTLREILDRKVSIAAFRNLDFNDLLGRAPAKLALDDPEVVETYCGKRILITGAGGSIGSELALQLAKLKPRELVLLDKDENGLNDIYLEVRKTTAGFSIVPVVADIRSAQRLKAIFSKLHPEVVFHAAAHKHVHLMEMNPAEAILNNVMGTLNLVEQAIEFGAERFVLISTDKAVKPTSIMGATKRICEMIVQAKQNAANMHFCCVRFGNVIGSRGSVVPIFRKQILRGDPVTVTHEHARRYLMTIPEAVFLLIQAGTLGKSGEIFVLEMGEPVRIHDLAHDLIELSGLRPGLDIQVKVSQLHPGEKIDELLIDKSKEHLRATRFEKIYMIKNHARCSAAFWSKLQDLESAALRHSNSDILRLFRELDMDFQVEPRELPLSARSPSQRPQGSRELKPSLQIPVPFKSTR